MFRKIVRIPKILRYIAKCYDVVFYRRIKPFRPLRLQVEISNICNYRCQSCLRSIRSSPKQMMSLSQFQSIISEANPVYLVITGIGEALLNRNLCGMIGFAKKKGIIVKMDTNGLALTKELCQEIFSTRLDYLSISLGTLNEQIYGKIHGCSSANLPIVLKNLFYLIEYKKNSKIRTHIEVTLLISKLNIAYLPETIRRISTLDLDSVLCGLAMRRFSTNNDIFILDERNEDKRNYYINIFKQSQETAKKFGLIDLVKSIDWILDLINNKQPQPSTEKLCYFSVYNPFILSNGTMIPCCIAAMSVLSNNSYLRAMSMGNVFTDGFMNVWQGKKAQKVRYSILVKRDTFAYCKKCTYDESGLFKSFYRMSKLFYKN